jgi:hypothetical protein
MLKRIGALMLVALVVGGATLATRALSAHSTDPSGLTVHEWGTFTSIAGPDGQAMEWQPLTGPSDLPCFVTLLNPNSIKIGAGGIPALKATVRMETPVVYFYSEVPQTVRLAVTFHRGIVSEWYPRAEVAPAAPVPTMINALGRIQWTDVKITPGAPEHFPVERGASHYYAARATDASPIQVGTQQEKFLFYRGLASFPLLFAATVNPEGNVAIAQTRDRAIDTAILFERRGGKIGYTVVQAGGKDVVISRPPLNASVESLRADLHDILTAHGLYNREASAMLETWRDSWFEEGARVFYLLPQAATDALLPLQMDPKPASLARVFVGRVEIVTPEIQTDVANAILLNDRTVLRKYGRFLEPISRIVAPRLTATHNEGKIPDALRSVAPLQPTQAACAASRSSTPPTP